MENNERRNAELPIWNVCVSLEKDMHFLCSWDYLFNRENVTIIVAVCSCRIGTNYEQLKNTATACVSGNLQTPYNENGVTIHRRVIGTATELLIAVDEHICNANEEIRLAVFAKNKENPFELMHLSGNLPLKQILYTIEKRRRGYQSSHGKSYDVIRFRIENANVMGDGDLKYEINGTLFRVTNIENGVTPYIMVEEGKGVRLRHNDRRVDCKCTGITEAKE